MKNFLIWWIIFQLLFLWSFSANLEYEIKSNIYKCTTGTNNKKIEFILAWIIFPLVIFIPENNLRTEYCKNN